MYYEHFGLREPPFKITPDTRRFYTGGNRGAVLDAVVYAVGSGEGIVKVVGEVGSGKTMLCRMLEVKLPEHVEVVYLANPSLTPEDILHAIAFEMKLDVEPGASRLRVTQILQRRLLEKHAQGKQVVVFVEEAQSMPLETLEEIRLLSNLETQQHKLLQIVLFGQPELEQNLSPKHIRQLRERITHSFTLPPFTAEEISGYIDFRMRGAGYRGPEVFSKPAVRLLARYSEGLIRRINILADKALLAAFAADGHQVSPRHVKTAARDSDFTRRGPRPGWLMPAAAAAALVLAGGLLLLLGLRQGDAPAVPGPLPPSEPPGQVADSEPDSPAPAPASATAARSADAIPREPPAVPATPAGPEPAASEPARGGKAEPAPATVDVRPVAMAPAVDEPETRMGVLDTRIASDESGQEQPARASAAPDAAAADETMPDEVSMQPPPAQAPRAPSRQGSIVDRRLAATASWLDRAQGTHYSIQLMLLGAGREAALAELLRRWSRLSGLDPIYVYRTRIQGRRQLSILMGEYETYSRARAAMEELPAPLRESGPFIRRIQDVRRLDVAANG